jgi:cellobiose PTS system EIIB component
MKILLVCSAGMSTSLLVTKMEASAKEKGIEGKIWAVAGDAARANMGEADVVLLGPQVRYMLSQMQEMSKDFNNTPVDVINSLHYGMLNGEAVLEHAMGLVKK